MPTLLCRKISRTPVLLTQMKKETLSWPPLPVLRPNPLCATPSSPPSRSIDMSASRSRCRMPWEFETAVDFSPTRRANLFSVVFFSRLSRPIWNHPHRLTPLGSLISLLVEWMEAKDLLFQVAAKPRSLLPLDWLVNQPAHIRR